MKRKGIILNSMDYQESHKILYILSEYGIDSLLVRRAKRYNSGLLNSTQKLSKIEYLYSEKNLHAVNEVFLLDSYSEIKDDFDKMILCEYITEVLHKVTFDNINFKLLYLMIENLLEKIKNNNNYKVLFLQFKLKMLYFYGILPNFKECYICNSKEVIGLSITNGCECKLHKSYDNIGMDATKIIYLLYKDQFNIEELDDEVIKLINNIVEKFYQKHFFITFKSEELLKTSLKIN